MLRNKKGQNTAEYAIIIALVVAAAIGMQTYVKRGLQGRMKDATNSYTSSQNDPNWKVLNIDATPVGDQYEVKELSAQSTSLTGSGSYDKSTMEKGGKVTRESLQRTQQKAGDYQQYEGAP